MDTPKPAIWIRAVRDHRRISQRDLSKLSGVPRSTIERIEAGRVSPRFDTLDTLVRSTGFEIGIGDRRGRELARDAEREGLLDRGGRHFPAHLRTFRVADYVEYAPPPGYSNWWGWHNIAWPYTDDWVPSHTFWRRNDPPPVVSLNEAPPWLERVWDDAT